MWIKIIQPKTRFSGEHNHDLSDSIKGGEFVYQTISFRRRVLSHVIIKGTQIHSHISDFMRFEIPTALTTKTTIFWDVTLYGLEKFIDITGEHIVSIIRVLLLTCLAYSSTQKMQVINSSNTLVNFYHTTWHHMPKIVIFKNIFYFLSVYHNSSDDTRSQCLY